MKNVVITGSTRGIGLSMAIEFLRVGCNVSLSGRGEVLVEETIASLSLFKGRYIYVPCDVRQKASLQNLWDVSLAQWSTKDIDIWFANCNSRNAKTGKWYNLQHGRSWLKQYDTA